jgi:large subunit ribosomal protein L17
MYKRSKRKIKIEKMKKFQITNLLKSIITHEVIKTTLTKAKRVQPIVEHLIHIAKKNDVTQKRYALKYLKERKLVKKLFDTIAPRFMDRTGGYTRITRLGFRKGDCAPIALFEIIGHPEKKKKKKEKKK